VLGIYKIYTIIFYFFFTQTFTRPTVVFLDFFSPPKHELCVLGVKKNKKTKKKQKKKNKKTKKQSIACTTVWCFCCCSTESPQQRDRLRIDHPSRSACLTACSLIVYLRITKTKTKKKKTKKNGLCESRQKNNQNKSSIQVPSSVYLTRS
jgi:hypothetical protein